MKFLVVIVATLFWTIVKTEPFEDQSKLISENGHLIIESAQDKNISLRIRGKGSLLINDVIIQDLIKTDTSTTNPYLSFRNPYNIGRNPLVSANRRRIDALETRVRNLTSILGRRPVGNQYMRNKVHRLETQLQEVLLKLNHDNCRSNPCRHGGTCIDSYDSFICKCPQSWEGPTCDDDVNECSEFAGTDLGCQNGAQCVNEAGNYRCICQTGWKGLHCTKKNADCLTSSTDLCGHGVCVQTNDIIGYTCICEQGWKTGTSGPACVEDVNECNSGKPVCSMEPRVVCINLPGSFICGPCPTGYNGNGFHCSDIDECSINNGGCSQAPSVSCTNTRGSYRCGACPSGWAGDGKVCVQSINYRACSQPNICHSLAQCTDLFGTVTCVCPNGYVGDGFGPFGCTVSSDPCYPNHCLNGGTCVRNGTSFSCVCRNGFQQPDCRVVRSACQSDSCKNGGTCTTTSSNTVKCTCAQGFSGEYCQDQRSSCGGILATSNGTLKYPEGVSIYPHNARCAWLIRTDASKILNVTFTRFNLKPARDCRFDMLQVHDGRTTADLLIGRFCGSTLPKGGNIISTRNLMYLWFRAESAEEGEGFELSWKSIDPICGGNFDVDRHGYIASPGSPGQYPPNRDCYWRLTAPPGKRIQINFLPIQIESHATCEYDYLAIYEGLLVANTNLLVKYCNRTHPEPLVAPSNEITIHFHSDGDETDTGFQIQFAIVEGVPGCGGTFTEYSGEIEPPRQNGFYMKNLMCEYVIRMAKGTSLKVEFKDMGIEASYNCLYDYIEIREDSSSGPLQGRWCGYTTPPLYSSTSNVVVIIFKTDSTLEDRGFKISYTGDCGRIYRDDNGVITSPNYPNNYPHSRTCLNLIESPLGTAIDLTFEEFDVESSFDDTCMHDYVEVIDPRLQANSTILGRFCGTTKPPEFFSSVNNLLVKFESDSSVDHKGFKASYKFRNISCGGIVRNSSVVIRPPLGANNLYLHLTDCFWVIVAPVGKVIQLSWNSFSLEDFPDCQSDSVTVYDTDASDGIIGRYCGETLPPTLTSTSNKMSIAFASDVNIAHEGFEASIIFVDASSQCGGTYYTSTGFIRSPGWPNEYTANKICQWVISVPNNKQIELNVLSFEMEENDACHFDYLEIRNGLTEAAPLIGKFCGSLIPKRIPSLANHLFIRFSSDITRQFKGFEIQWDATITGCGGTISNSQSGTITSSGYPQFYSANTECYYKIIVSEGSLIELKFLDLELELLDVECGMDYIEIFDGANVHSKSFGRFCREDHTVNILSTTNVIYAKFRSDESIQGRGFNIKYDSKCRREIRSLQGAIESPNFPDPYPFNAVCEWKIIAPRGNKISIDFSQFDLETLSDHCTYDKLEVIQQIEGRENTVAYCMERPKAFNTTENEVTIRFTSDSSVSAQGFRLEFAAQGCGGHLIKPMGIFTSPFHPNQYPTDVDCEWAISVEPGSTIELTITELSIGNAGDCTKAGLIISLSNNYDVDNITTLCGHNEDKPKVITANSHELFLKFMSQESHGQGFKAEYKTVIGRKCGGLLQINEGMFTSPNYPKVYDNDIYCEWVLEVAPSHSIELSFVDFDLEKNADCIADFIQIFDGHSKADKNLITMCGSDPTNNTIVSTTNKMLVTFKSNNQNQYKGFKASFKTSCGGTIITAGSGVISLPKSNKQQLYNCVWYIAAEDLEKKITFSSNIFGIPALTSVPSPENERCLYKMGVFDGGALDSPSRLNLCEVRNVQRNSLTSRGNMLTVKFETFTKEHIDFEGRFSVLDNACGGEYNNIRGRFASPNFPLSYPVNVSCIWTIFASPGSKITLHFPMGDIEDSEECSNDYVEIRENDMNGQLLKVLCGATMQYYTEIEYSKYWIKFRSDGDIVGRGFMGIFRYSDMNDISGESGVLTSPMYPKIAKNLDNEYKRRLNVKYGNLISLHIEEMYTITVDNSDTFKIYDGYDESAPLIVEFSMINTGTIFYSTSNVLFIVVSLSHLIESKFKISWTEISRDNRPSNVTDLSCGGKVIYTPTEAYFNSTILTSPGYPGGYAENLNCTWTIEPSIYGYSVGISVSVVDLEDTENCISDSLTILSSENLVDWTEEAKLCRYNYKTGMARFKGKPYLRVVFLSNYFTNGTGFEASLLTECGGILKDPTGLISIGGFSPIIRKCIWKVEVRRGRQIQFKLKKMENMEKTTDSAGVVICRSNLIIRNGMSEFSPFLGTGRFCGSDLPDIPETSSNYAYITFDESDITHRRIFELEYHETNVECGGEIILSRDNNSTEITSPNFPDSSQPHIDCVWFVVAPKGEPIKLDFLDRFDLTTSVDCSLEYVELRDGWTQNSRAIGQFCGEMPSTQITSTNMLRLKYFTSVEYPKSGFKVRASIASCGRFIRSASGTLMSPLYPKKGGYASFSNCEYRIFGSRGKQLNITFEDLDLPSLGALDSDCTSIDHVKIYSFLPDEYGNMTKVLENILCGQTVPLPIITEGNEAVIEIVLMNKDKERRGFKLSFISSIGRCGGVVNSPSGSIISPGYPIGRKNARFCEWKIKVPDGKRVKLVVDDFDVVEFVRTPSTRLGSSLFQRVGFYNDHSYISRIRFLRPNDTTETIYSSSNKMLISSYMRSNENHRGFKFTFTSDEATICEGSLNENEGFIVTPKTNESFFCEYSRNALLNGTLAFKVTEIETANRCLVGTQMGVIIYYQPLVQYRQRFLRKCRNFTFGTTRVPFQDFQLVTRQNMFSRNNVYSIEFKRHACGGVIETNSRAILNISLGLQTEKEVDCAWNVKVPEGQLISISFLNFAFQFDCEDEYLTITNGNPSSPLLTIVCKNNIPSGAIQSATHNLFVEYHVKAFSNRSTGQLYLDTTSKSCGGLINNNRYATIQIRPENYKNDMECVWEIQAKVGYHIKLSFRERFFIESSNNCTKDYLEVLDYVNGNWSVVSRFCGRSLPKDIFSSGIKIKIIFRTNEDKTADGFLVQWENVCGGTFMATEYPQFIVSPNYPSKYDRNLKCNYTIKAPASDRLIEIKFQDFALEWNSDLCMHDNLSVYTLPEYTYPSVLTFSKAYCKENSLRDLRSKGIIALVFQSDQFLEAKGFSFSFTVQQCGKNITTPQRISSPVHDTLNTYHGNLDCKWFITAPLNSQIVVQFDKFEVEHSGSYCNDMVAIYSGLNVTDDKKLAALCGNLTYRHPVISIPFHEGAISFKTDGSIEHGGFVAEVSFKKHCAEKINLTLEHSSQEINHLSSTSYESMLECTYIFEAPDGKAIRVEFDQFHVAPCVGRSDNCSCDYVEIRDGAGPLADLYGRYCGHTKPPVIVSSRNILFMKFVTDSVDASTGFKATVSLENTICGQHVFKMEKKPIVLSSPGVNQYPPNTICSFTITGEWDTLFVIHFEKMDLESDGTGKCLDYIEIQPSYQSPNYHKELGPTTQFIGNIAEKRAWFHMSIYKTSPVVLCGSQIPQDLLLSSNELFIKFQSNDENEQSGFKLTVKKYEICGQNLTALSGKITLKEDRNCDIYIQAPPNRKISLFFESFYIQTSLDACSDNALEVYNGTMETKHLVLKQCGWLVPNPVFSDSSLMTISMKKKSSAQGYARIDMYYLIHENNVGCGGSMNNLAGVFASPFYPENRRLAEDCTWTIEVQPPSKIALKFKEFDLGANRPQCDINYVELSEKAANGTFQSMRIFCEEVPATYISTSSTLSVRFKKTPNFNGIGWVAQYMAVDDNTIVEG